MAFLIAIAAIIFFVNWLFTPEKFEPKTMAKHYVNGYELNKDSKEMSGKGWNVDSVIMAKDGHIIVVYKSSKI